MNEFNENQVKHLEMVQSIISRMASNSFQLKALFITIFSALLALFFKVSILKTNTSFVILVLALITAVFWILDSYYLSLEKMYRNLYNKLIKNQKECPVPLFDLTPIMSKKSENGYTATNILNCFWSKSNRWFYPPIFLSVLGILVFIKIY